MPTTRDTVQFSTDPDFDYEIRCAIGMSAADPGEVLAATASVRKGDHRAWSQAWLTLADRAKAVATECAAAGHRVSAAEAFLRASAHFGVAVNALSAADEVDRMTEAFAAQEDAWHGFLANTDTPVDPLSINYPGGTMPGWFCRPATPNGATLVAVNGSDGSRASLWTSVADPALRRGYHVLLFDGPGQQSQLFEAGVPFRPDWENVLPSVYDAVAALDGVDPARVAVYGISQGGYWVARGITAEARFAAAVADPGVVDVSTSWTAHLPADLMALLDTGDTEQFDQALAVGLGHSAEARRTWQFRARPYGTSGYAQTVQAVRQYTVADLAHRITTPLLILSPENEQFWPGQSERLAALAPAVSTVQPFTAAEGADRHCQPLGRQLTAQRMFDWLDERLAR